MNKQEIVKAIIAAIEAELASATQAAKDSASEATDEESRPENKYDTRGLEQSYVASAQAHFAKDLKESLQAYHNLKLRDSASNEPVALGSLVTTLSSNGRERFFIGPAHGGIEIRDDEGDIIVVTPSSPVGSQLIGKQIGGKAQGAETRTVIRVE